MKDTKKFLMAAVMATGLALSACAPTSGSAAPAGSAGAGKAAEPVNVGIIYSKTGPLAAYGATYYQGLQAGIDYATNGTGEINGAKINLTYADDAGDPDKAVTAAKDMIGKGYKIIGGTASSGIAVKLAEQAQQNKILYISGAAATDAIQGVNKYTFRSGRQSLQDVATAGTFIDPKDKKVVVFAQDNAFGQGNVAAVKAVLGAKGAAVSSVLVPENQELTPFARQLLDAKPDMVFVAWAGATTGTMWQSLSQQGVFDAAPVVTGLGDASSFGAYGPASSKISFLSHYFPGASGTEVEKKMIAGVEKAGGKADLFTPDGFVLGQLIAQAIKEGGGTDPDAMVKSLEGFSFDGPKGKETVRASDHALIQDMYQAKLVQKGDTWAPELVKAVPADTVAPPEKKK
ncbi:substrate-binding domain-containing protein [Arthrobacter sp. B3I4]|uniref:substrate-binding domain-containing protein n=1 Tax=Arthrobacter sp. B3I4 TaxID=3042267 RepID=UPI00278A0234|nr:substrate-binding domain-containing protein [Arthrobacter sp. B3I4]MDQ0756949.1 branched-chain amino acid transport system substrate-binding protein [Arthrobacter sp. B3I4]